MFCEIAFSKLKYFFVKTLIMKEKLSSYTKWLQTETPKLYSMSL